MSCEVLAMYYEVDFFLCFCFAFNKTAADKVPGTCDYYYFCLGERKALV